MSNPKRQPRSIGYQVLVAVNLPIAILLCGLLVVQYHREMKQAVAEKRSSLNDEAIAVHAATSHLSNAHSNGAAQEYIDSVSKAMRAAWSPHHHIVVGLDGKELIDRHSKEESCQMLGDQHGGDSAGEQVNSFRVASHVVGLYSDGGIDVKVSESTDLIRRSARRDILSELGALAVLGLVAALALNLILLHLIGRPLRQLLGVVGDISDGQLGVQAPALHSREMQELASEINAMSTSLAKADQNRRLQMLQARKIQQHLLPNGVQAPCLQTAHVFEPADEVGGDYYDFLPLRDGSWLICLADVTGHGVPAAMGASMLKTLLFTESERNGFDLCSAIATMNSRFADTILPGNFASMFLGKWNPATLELTYANAGHEPGILMRSNGKVDLLESTGMLLGIDSCEQWEHRTVRLHHGDRLLLFSDGATETHSPDGTIFGRSRLVDALIQNADCGPSRAVVNVDRCICDFRGDSPQFDDLTLVLMSCNNPTAKECNSLLHESTECHASQNLMSVGTEWGSPLCLATF